jgi:glycosyltransferase involved in cell wall biosynthesis
VFCYTETDKERVRDFGVPSRIEVISNGIDTERFTPDGPESELIDHDEPVVLFVGRLVEGKRPGLAVEAFARVREKYPGAELYFCGEGSLRGKLMERAAELGVCEAVTFLGQIPYEEMPNVYRSADVLVLPSQAEGVPRTIMEALASGVPVVSSDLPQVRSAFGESVSYVKSGNTPAYCNRICEVLNYNPDAKLDRSFQWQRTVKETTATLQTLAV